MANYSGIERLLGLPEGSTEQGERDVKELLAKGVKDKTKELEKKATQLDTLDNMASSDLVKAGFTLESLEQDKVTIRTEAFEVYRIAKTLLERYKEQIDSLVDVNDRMWLAGGKMVDSVVGSLDKLTNMILKFKQEEELKNLTVLDENDDGSKEMTPGDWMNFVNEVRDDDDDDDTDAVEGEIIESEDK
jgi:hypothetical protein